MAHVGFLPGYFLTLCLATTLVLCKEVRWDRETVTANQGDDVTVTCTATGLRLLDILRITREFEDAASVTIAERDQLKAEFQNAKRYSVEYAFNRKEKTATMVLQYKGIRGEDAGTIGCFILGNNPERATVDITVQVPVDRLYFIQKESDGSEAEVAPMDEIILVEHEDNGFACNATMNGSMTPPTVTILIGGEDETASFEPHPDAVKKNANGGLSVESSYMLMKYYTSKPNPDFNGKTVECLADADGFDTKKIEATLNIQFEPIITCKQYEHFTIPGSKLKLSCDIRSNPSAKIKWEWGTDSSAVESPEENEGLKAFEEEFKDDRVKAHLEIKQADATHFTKFLLTASNKIGSKTVTMAVSEGSSPPKTQPPEKVQRDNTELTTMTAAKETTTVRATTQKSIMVVKSTPDPLAVTGGSCRLAASTHLVHIAFAIVFVSISVTRLL